MLRHRKANSWIFILRFLERRETLFQTFLLLPPPTQSQVRHCPRGFNYFPIGYWYLHLHHGYSIPYNSHQTPLLFWSNMSLRRHRNNTLPKSMRKRSSCQRLRKDETHVNASKTAFRTYVEGDHRKFNGSRRALLSSPVAPLQSSSFVHHAWRC